MNRLMQAVPLKQLQIVWILSLQTVFHRKKSIFILMTSQGTYEVQIKLQKPKCLAYWSRWLIHLPAFLFSTSFSSLLPQFWITMHHYASNQVSISSLHLCWKTSPTFKEFPNVEKRISDIFYCLPDFQMPTDHTDMFERLFFSLSWGSFTCFN